MLSVKKPMVAEELVNKISPTTDATNTKPSLGDSEEVAVNWVIIQYLTILWFYNLISQSIIIGNYW